MKLPIPRKRGETYTVTLSYQNKRYYCTRDTAKECEQWAALKLLELKSQTRIESGELKPKFSFRDLNTKSTLVKKFENKVSALQKYAEMKI